MSINFGWAVGVAMAVWISGGISGCHNNPAVGFNIPELVTNINIALQVTLTLAVFRGFPWRKVPVRCEVPSL